MALAENYVDGLRAALAIVDVQINALIRARMAEGPLDVAESSGTAVQRRLSAQIDALFTTHRTLIEMIERAGRER